MCVGSSNFNVLYFAAVYNLRKGDKTIQQTKEAIIARVINILTSYRRHCAQPGTSLGNVLIWLVKCNFFLTFLLLSGQLILPESLKLLPMYTCGILKCDAIDGGPEMNPDDKAFAQLKMLGSHPSLSQVFLYPRLYKIEVCFVACKLYLKSHFLFFLSKYEDANEENLKFSQIRCSSYKLNAPALGFILENGFYVLFLITTAGCANVKFLNGLFGNSVDSAAKIHMEAVRFLRFILIITDCNAFLHHTGTSKFAYQRIAIRKSSYQEDWIRTQVQL